jgi:hypothetical protein
MVALPPDVDGDVIQSGDATGWSVPNQSGQPKLYSGGSFGYAN